MATKKYASILTISDTHFPYEHPDTLDFLKELKSVYKPEHVVHIGDEIDGHSIHPTRRQDPNLPSPEDELRFAVEKLQGLYKLFPDVDVVESNHGSLVYRSLTEIGLPSRVAKSYREILEAPDGWNWHFDLTLTMSDGNKVYFCHGKTGAPGKLSQSMSMSCVQGHYHEKFEVIYWANPNGLFWDMRIGCLVNDHDLAFNYNNTNLKRPIIGTGVILDGQPLLCPMVLDKGGRWIGKLL